MHLCYLEPVSCVFTSWISLGLTIGSGCSLLAARWQGFFPSWVPSELTSSPSVVAAIYDNYDILSLLIGQEIFHFSTSQTPWSRQISEDVAGVPAFEQVPKMILMNSQKNWPLGGTCCFKYSLCSSCVSFIPPVRLFAPGGILHVLMFLAGGYIHSMGLVCYELLFVCLSVCLHTFLQAQVGRP